MTSKIKKGIAFTFLKYNQDYLCFRLHAKNKKQNQQQKNKKRISNISNYFLNLSFHSNLYLRLSLKWLLFPTDTLEFFSGDWLLPELQWIFLHSLLA